MRHGTSVDLFTVVGPTAAQTLPPHALPPPLHFLNLHDTQVANLLTEPTGAQSHLDASKIKNNRHCRSIACCEGNRPELARKTTLLGIQVT
jgi:hypothetical protein